MPYTLSELAITYILARIAIAVIKAVLVIIYAIVTGEEPNITL